MRKPLLYLYGDIFILIKAPKLKIIVKHQKRWKKKLENSFTLGTFKLFFQILFLHFYIMDYR
jgi:hypothetical protein